MYMPALKNKQGELRALQKSEEDGVKNILPLIEINEATEDVLKKISSKYSGNFVIDTHQLDGSDIIYLNELITTNNLFTKIEIAFPASILNSEDARSEIDNINYIEIDKDYLGNSFFLDWLKHNKSSVPENIILNLEYIDSNSLNADLTLITSFLNILENQSRNVFILSGAIPQPIPKKSTENYECRRTDFELFTSVLNLCSNNPKLADLKILFGDYTTVSPIQTDYTNKVIIPIVQIKYTTQDKYILVRNGQRKGNYNLSDVCEEIVNFQNFDKSHCWSDKYIFDLASSTDTNRGNPSTWASLGIEHHIMLCSK